MPAGLFLLALSRDATVPFSMMLSPVSSSTSLNVEGALDVVFGADLAAGDAPPGDDGSFNWLFELMFDDGVFKGALAALTTDGAEGSLGPTKTALGTAAATGSDQAARASPTAMALSGPQKEMQSVPWLLLRCAL